MTIAIFGGTFDPWTSAHQQILQTLSEKYRRVIVIPTAIRYYKAGNQMFSFEERMRSAREHSRIFANARAIDIEKNVDENWRFVHTLQAVRGMYGTDNEYYVAIGSDALQKFTSWFEWQKILENASLVVFNRPGFTKDFPDIPFEYLPMENPASSTEVRNLLRLAKM